MLSLPNRLWQIPVYIIRLVKAAVETVSVGGIMLSDLLGEIQVILKQCNIPVLEISIGGLFLLALRPFQKVEQFYGRRVAREYRLEPAEIKIEPGPSRSTFSCPKNNCTLENPCSECAKKAEWANEENQRKHERQKQRRRHEREWKKLSIWYQASTAWKRVVRWLYS
jgi:hypothetical protein